MIFEELKEFLENKMWLNHIYQPLLIGTLVELGGYATVRQLAITFLARDESQIRYYEKKLRKMPIRVLEHHGLIRREGELVSLSLNVKRLTLEQKAEIKRICEAKIQGFIESRGLSIWDHRLLDDNPVSDSLRLRVLKEARGRCALCGATRDERILDVDHIIPRSKGGKTEYENLQVLCSKCNRSKQDKDDSDFRNLLESSFSENCVFCQLKNSRGKVVENDYAFAVPDENPVTEGHTLIVTKRHFADFFESTRKEQNAAHDLLNIRRKQLMEQDSSIKGFNIGVNSGKAAGQTVFHVHIHLIPRREADISDPRGGVRNVIPAKKSAK